MKKLLAICSVFLSVCATFTGCGANDNSGTSDREDSAIVDDGDYMDRDEDPTAERIDDEIDDVKDAGEDIIGGATDAIDDIMGGDSRDRDRDERDERDERERHSEENREKTTDR